MNKKDVFSYFCFGYNYNLLLRHGKLGSWKLNEDSGKENIPDSLEQGIEEFFQQIDDLNLVVTKKASFDVKAILNDLKQKKDDHKGNKVDELLADKVKTAFKKLDATLDAELQLRHSFEITPKHFSIESLTDDIGNIFGEGVFSSLPPISQFDFQEAGKCIAFALPTASVFHSMRGVEGVLRHYYELIVKRGRMKDPTWGAIIIALEKRYDRPSKNILDSLNNIRHNYRNPTQHPDARYDLDTAQDLLSVSIEAVNKMIKDLEERGTFRPPF